MALSDMHEVEATTPAARADSSASVAVPQSNIAAAHILRVMPIAQLLAVVLGVLAIIWNQQQGIDSLRAEFNQAHSELRAEFNQAHSELRAEFNRDHSGLRAEVIANGQRLARIEGHLGIGTPSTTPK